MNHPEKETENKTQKIELDIPTGEIALLQQFAKDKGKDVNQILSQIINEKIAEDKGEPMTFEENGVVYERLSIDLPKNIVNFYRYKAHAKGIGDLTENLITFDIADHLYAEIEGNSSDDWKELFNLGLAFDGMFNREELLLRNSPRSKGKNKIKEN
jgi:hypothetical protein